MDNQISHLEDSVSKCHSIMFQLKLSDYLSLISSAFDNSGNITGQRTTLKSQSAKKIRDQMTTDFKQGSVLPPVVIGLVDENFNPECLSKHESFINYLNKNKDTICIIDGMQRTTAMINGGDGNEDRIIRVELWLTETISKLIYRMLVLNTGQVPWTMKRQLEVVLHPIMKEINNKIENIELLKSNDEKRRSVAGNFQAEKIIESFLIFGARSVKANTRDAIAEEYTKLDFIESSSKQELLDLYVELLKRIVNLDIEISKIAANDDATGKFKKGLDLFTSQPALIGITAAFAIKILGRPKRDYPVERQHENLNAILDKFDSFIEKLKLMSDDQLNAFFNLESLNSMSPSHTSSKIGDVEREYFKSAFTVLIEDDFEVENMEICWGH